MSSNRPGWLGAGLALAFVSAAGVAIPRAAQQTPPKVTMPPAAISVDEAAALAQYWRAIAEKKPAEVALQARQLLERYPRSIAVLATSIEAEIAANGASTALTQYERWLGGRTMEEPGVVRRIARAVLYEFTRQTADGAARSEALVLLAREGDAAAQAVILNNAASGQSAGLRDAVRLGESQAISRVAARLKSPGADKIRDIQLLGESASPLAVPALVPFLKDPAEQVRSNAARALGRTGSATAVTSLEPALKDSHGIVRADAAAALYRLGSAAGIAVLEEYASSEEPGLRKFAAQAMAVRPDERWLALVRGLLSAPDPMDRLDAATLLAPHDPAAARSVLEQLAADPNLGVQEATELVRAELVSTSLSDLRSLLKSRNLMARVRAGGRILALTR
jgi:HEAT repeat protein